MQRFHIRVALIGSPTTVVEVAISDLQQRLEARTHLDNPRVYWDSASRRAIVEVDAEAPTSQSAGGGVYDDVFESACAVLGDFEFIRVEVLEVVPIAT